MVVLSPFEIESMAESLEPLPMPQVGSVKWMQQAQYLEKLKLQACRDALSRHDELVVDTLITNDRLSVLVHRLITLEQWRCKLLPNLMGNRQISEMASMKIYLLLYQEATVCSILVVALYQQSAVESLSDIVIELTDYCYRRFVALNAGEAKDEGESGESESIADRIQRQSRSIEFRLAADAISMMRFLSDRIEQIPSAVVARMLDKQDMIVALVNILNNNPFTRRDKKQIWKFSDQEWYAVDPSDHFRLSRLQGNLWIAIYNFMASPACKQKYKLDEYRKSVIITLKRYFNEVLIDQLPFLEEIWRYVEQLAITDIPADNSQGREGLLLVEQLPEIYDGMQNLDFPAISNAQLQDYFRDDILRSELKIYADFFGDDEDMIEQRCEQCHRPAQKRCSVCKQSWFCSRQCQVEYWPMHKRTCSRPNTE